MPRPVDLQRKRNKEQEEEVLKWIEDVLNVQITRDIPYETVLKDGILLCRVMNTLWPGSVKKINTEPGAGGFKFRDNLCKFQDTAEQYGLPRQDMFQTIDLWESKDIATVTFTIHALGRTAQKNGWNGPKLGPKPAEENKRNFSDDQLRQGEAVLGLQAGFNKGATQAGMTFGKNRMITKF